MKYDASTGCTDEFNVRQSIAVWFFETEIRDMKRMMLIAAVLFFTLAGAGRTEVYAAENDTITDNVYIGDINVSGMTAEEAQTAIQAKRDSVANASFTLQTAAGSVTVSAQELGISINGGDVIEEAMQLGKSGSIIARYKAKKDLQHEPKVYDMTYGVIEEKVRDVLESSEDSLTIEPKDSTIKRVDGGFSIEEGNDGTTLLVDDSVREICSFVEDGWDGQSATIDLATETQKPKGSVEELSKIQDLLGSYHTDFSSSASGRYKNVQNGCSKIDGSIIYPGEQFSVYEAVSPFEAENGYELAGSYENGTTVQTYGGGICQVSTTLYNAVIRAELQVDERYNHSMVVSYVPLSADAAISGTSKDFKFTNNTDAPIYIEGYTSGGIIYFNVFGQETREAGRTVEFESETVSQTDPGVSLIADAGQPIGYVATQQGSHTGYTARLWKIVKQDGVEVSRTEFNNSRYNASNRVVVIGTATANEEANAQMTAAIVAGDENWARSVAATYAGQ